MKKYILLILSLFFIPFVVFAEDSNYEIKSIEFVSKSDKTEIINEATTDGLKINVDLKFYDEGDYVKYKLLLINNTESELSIDENSLIPDNKYIEYEFKYLDNSKTIQSGEEKEVLLTISYGKYAPSELFRSSVYDASNSIEIALDQYIRKIDILDIPNTLKNIGIVGIIFINIIIALIIFGIYLIKKNNGNSNMLLLLFVLLIILVPKNSKAAERLLIPVNSNIIIQSVTPTLCTTDEELVQGLEYRISPNSQYVYRYKQQWNGNSWENTSYDGWGVKLVDFDSEDDVTETLCSTINDKPLTSMSFMFYYSKAKSIDLSSFVTDNVENMTSMFFGASNIKELDFRTFNTESLTTMNYMLSGCPLIEELTLRQFVTSNVTSYYSIFGGDTNLKKLNLDGWDLTKAGMGSGQFSGTTSLKEISAKDWVLPQYFNNWLSSAWGGTNSPIEKVDVTGWDFSKSNTYSIYGLFGNSTSLKEVKGLDTWDTTTIKDVSYLFNNCEQIEKIDLSSFDLSNVTSISYMLNNNKALREFDTPLAYPNLNYTIYLTNIFKDEDDNYSYKLDTYSNYLPVNQKLEFYDEGYILEYGYRTNSRMKQADGNSYSGSSRNNTIKEIKFSETPPSESIMNNENSIISLSSSPYKIYTWYSNNILYIYSNNNKVYLNEDSNNIFSNFGKLEKFDLSNFDAMFVENIKWMFYYTGYDSTNITIDGIDKLKIRKPVSLESAFQNFGYNSGTITINDFDKFDATQFTDIQYMFSHFGDNANTINLDMSNWNMKNVEKVQYAFESFGEHARNINLNLSNWNIGKATSLYGMLKSVGTVANNLTINVTGMKFPNATNLSNLFEGTGIYSSNLSLVGLDNWDVSKVQNFYGVFTNVGRTAPLVDLDLSNWDMSSATSISYMFKYMSDGSGEVKLNISNWKFADNVYTYNFMNNLGGSNSKVTIIAKNWDLSNQTSNLENLFGYVAKGVTGEVNIDLSDWNLNGVTSLYGFFNSGLQNCREININLSGWDTSTITNMNSMFASVGSGSGNVEVIGLDDFDTRNVTTMNYMFSSTIHFNLNHFKIYPNTSINGLFRDSKHIHASVDLKGPITNYTDIFKDAAEDGSSNSTITVNYDSNVTNIDDIINSKTDGSHVVKGQLIE